MSDTDEMTELRKHSSMLGRIANLVSEFSESETDTTLLCVARLKAHYLDLQSKLTWELVDRLEEEKD